MPYTIEELRRIITPIAQAHGLRSVSLFGSYSKGTARRDSDVDLKIEKGSVMSLFQLSGLRLDIEDALKVPVELVTNDSSDHEFLDMMRCFYMGIPEIKSVVSRLGREYGAQRIWLFGSYARGDMTPTSDIDLRIDKGRIRGIEMGGLLLDLEDALGVPVDLIPTGSLSERFLSSIQKDEVLLYEA